MPVFGKPRTSHTGDRPLDRRAPSNKTGARTRQTNTRQRAPYYPLLRTAVDYKRKKCLGCIVAMVPGPKGPRVQVSSRSSPRVQEYKGPIVRLSNDQCFQLELVETLKSPRVQGSKGPRLHAYERGRVQGSKSTRVQGSTLTSVQEYKGPRVQESKGPRVRTCKSTRVQEYKSARVQGS